MVFAFLFLGYETFFFRARKDHTSISLLMLQSNIFAENLQNLTLGYLGSITVLCL